jgi:hypothetical protein
MKKVFVGFSLSLAALGFLLSPAMAANPPQAARVLSVADQTFLASLAPVGSPAPQLAAKGPAIGQKSECDATANCGGGVTITCHGLSSCSAADRNCTVNEPGHVTCDGTPTSCTPACPPPSCDCAALRADCIADCSPCPILFSCNATTCVSSCRCRITSFCTQ